MNAPTITNPDHQKRTEGVIAALRRAKRDTEELAIATGTELVLGRFRGQCGAAYSG